MTKLRPAACLRDNAGVWLVLVWGQSRGQAWRELSPWDCLAQGLLLLSDLMETLWQALRSTLQAQAHGTSFISTPQELVSEESLEERGSVAMAGRSHLQQEGPSEASEDYRCAICLDNISNMACVYPCFHRFCTDCIQRWATTRPVCPLCRQPIDRVLHTVRADDDYQEYVVRSSSHRQRRRAAERSRSRSPLRHRRPRNNGFPARSSSTGSGQVSRADTAPSAPAASTSGEQSPPSAAERIVSPGDGEQVRIGTLLLPPLRIQLPSRTAQ